MTSPWIVTISHPSTWTFTITDESGLMYALPLFLSFSLMSFSLNRFDSSPLSTRASPYAVHARPDLQWNIACVAATPEKL